MIKILCLAPNVSEILAIKKRIQDEIFACKELLAYQRWVRPGVTFYPMRTENCEIDFRLPNPDKTGGLNVDLVYGVFDCDYSDELIDTLTSKRSLGLQKKYGKSELPIWEIVLEIEKQYGRVTEGMFKEEMQYMNKTVCYKCDIEPSVLCGECPVWLAGEEVSEKERIAYRKGFEDGVKLANQKETNERSCNECKLFDTCKDRIDVRTVEDDIRYGMVIPNYIPGPNAECLSTGKGCCR